MTFGSWTDPRSSHFSWECSERGTFVGFWAEPDNFVKVDPKELPKGKLGLYRTVFGDRMDHFGELLVSSANAEFLVDGIAGLLDIDPWQIMGVDPAPEVCRLRGWQGRYFTETS